MRRGYPKSKLPPLREEGESKREEPERSGESKRKEPI
jgi:hypothetical protein